MACTNNYWRANGSAGLICILRAYAGQLEGDFIELFCTDLLVPVDFHTVTEQEAREEKPIPPAHMCVPPARRYGTIPCVWWCFSSPPVRTQ